MDHLTLENEIAAELNPFSTGVVAGSAPSLRRETVLSMLNQTAQLAYDFGELLGDAGFLGAAITEMEWFVGAEAHDKHLVVSAGMVTDSPESPVIKDQITRDARRSAFQFAIEAGHPVIVANAANETRFRDPYLGQRGIVSGVVCPINYRDKQYGAIGFFSPEQRQLSKDNVIFLQSIALFLGPARAHQLTEKSLAEHKRVLSSAIDSLEAMVLLLSIDGGILQINRTCQSAGGFTLSELRGRKIWSAYWKPSESASAESVLAELRGGARKAKREAFFVTKQGSERRVSWTFAKLHDGDSTGPAILATGIDITVQYNSLKELDQVNRSKVMDAAESSSNQWLTPEEPKVTETPERRRHDRRPFQCIQMVAPCVDGKLPKLSQFRDVRCYDISPGGFSFLLGTRPGFEDLVAAFGANNSRLYLRARVRHVTPITFENRKVLLIGCEYVGRVRAPLEA